MTANIVTKTLRPGLLVSLKSTVRGGVSYDKKIIEAERITEEGAEEASWETKRVIADPKEFALARKARSKACSAIRSCCTYSAFGLLCPEADKEKLDAAVKEAREICDAFNRSSTISNVSIYVITGRVSPDDVEAVRAINSEIRELMAEMGNGVENRNVDGIREAASQLKSMTEMLNAEAAAKVRIAVDTARATAKRYVKEDTTEVDKSAARRIEECRLSFLDLDDADAEVAAPKAKAAPQLDLAAE